MILNTDYIIAIKQEVEHIGLSYWIPVWESIYYYIFTTSTKFSISITQLEDITFIWKEKEFYTKYLKGLIEKHKEE